MNDEGKVPTAALPGSTSRATAAAAPAAVPGARARAHPPPALDPRRRPAAVIFDMDGLMLDTEPLAARAWTDAAVAAGLPFDHAVTPRLIGRNFADCRALIAGHHGAGYPVDDLMRAWHVAYDAIVDREGLALKAGLGALLDWLDEARIPKAVATSTRRSRALAKLDRTALTPRFVAVVGGDEIARGKPAPDIFVEAAVRLGAPAPECVVLEDSEPGVRGALAAGMRPIMVPDLHAPSAALAAASVLVLADLIAVRDHLAALPA
jgi:HAD superfamily hydrolase (TIGR01509 family)